ncbi:hypothetical protein NBRGN_044_00040 [Nocardia brasiliensis NBRC 14402]|nr:hypothetical protein NBRGN_044_00040 [Nocardia brasiliensis NBRC 14402]
MCDTLIRVSAMGWQSGVEGVSGETFIGIDASAVSGDPSGLGGGSGNRADVPTGGRYTTCRRGPDHEPATDIDHRTNTAQ